MDDLLAAARRLATSVRETRDYGEHHRHLEPGVLAAMHEAQLFRMMIPTDTDGLQTELTTAMRVVETIAAADGATGELVARAREREPAGRALACDLGDDLGRT